MLCYCPDCGAVHAETEPLENPERIPRICDRCLRQHEMRVALHYFRKIMLHTPTVRARVRVVLAFVRVWWDYA